MQSTFFAVIEIVGISWAFEYPTIVLSMAELVGVELVKQVRIVAIHFGESKN